MARRGRPTAEVDAQRRGARDARALGKTADERPGAGPALPHRARLPPRGWPTGEIAAAVGVPPGHGRQVAARASPSGGLDGLHDEPRPGKPRTIGDDDVERVIIKTLEETPRGCDPLVDPLDGRGHRHEPVRGEPHLAGLRPEAPSARDLQALHRPAVHREGAGHRRALPEPARGGGRALRRREDAGPGAGAHGSDPAAACRPPRRGRRTTTAGTARPTSTPPSTSPRGLRDQRPHRRVTAPRSSAAS